MYFHVAQSTAKPRAWQGRLITSAGPGSVAKLTPYETAASCSAILMN
jgi:hypothetical protein